MNDIMKRLHIISSLTTHRINEHKKTKAHTP